MKLIYSFKPYFLIKLMTVLFFSFSIKKGFSQDNNVLEINVQGQLIDGQTKAYLPYAHVYNLRTKTGSVTDENGFFGFEGSRLGDTLSVSFIGYHSKNIIINSDEYLTIELKENNLQLSELTLEYDNSDYLYELISDCRKNKSKVKAEGKAYYELHSYRGNNQVELVESFYNAEITGYDLKNLKLKVGRLGVQVDENGGTLASLESSKAILRLKLIEDSENFYENPLQLSYRQLKKYYDLNVFKTYKENTDEMMVIRFLPKSEKFDVFSGMVWVNKTTKQVHKMSLECEDCRKHPFIVTANNDRKIDHMDLEIIKTFEPKDGGMVLNHIDFKYTMSYLSRQNKMQARTQVLVHIYNFDETFNLPFYNSFNEPRHNQDYREIGEAPYNSFFWENHDEFSVFDKGNENKTYFNHPNTIQGEQYLHQFRISGGKESEFFEHPSFTWSKKRLRFAEARKEDSTKVNFDDKTYKYYGGDYNGQFKSDMYKFYGKIYLDRNEYKNQIHITLESIFDSSRSYYKLPVDWKVQVFVNMYFDLVEIEKRKLEELINQSDKTIETINTLYTASEFRLNETHKRYLKEMRRGEDREAMEKWSKHILNELKINNMEAFIQAEE